MRTQPRDPVRLLPIWFRCFLIAALTVTAVSIGFALVARAEEPPAHTPDAAHQTQVGVASWYGYEHAGRLTASGTAFDPAQMIAAHRKLPLGTVVRVTHLASGRSVIVKIVDRGPYRRGRIIDLSHGAATLLGMTSSGLARVRIDTF